MKEFLWVMVSPFLVTGVSACNSDDYSEQEIVQPPGSNENPEEDKNPSTSNRMKIIVGSIIFTATLADNNTGNTFKTMISLF